ncbi:MAG: hypothetical protein VXW87_00970 [Pseudomonadota bacterium]|nr:hypothetical protein [Pseudomonadota bacterium]
MKGEGRSWLMGVGLIPLILVCLMSVPKVWVGWLVGTYPLIVIAFIAGMQFQVGASYMQQFVCMLYPGIISMGLLIYGGAFEFFTLGLVFGLVVDLIHLLQKQVRPEYVIWRSVLVLLFVLLLYMIERLGV